MQLAVSASPPNTTFRNMIPRTASPRTQPRAISTPLRRGCRVVSRPAKTPCDASPPRQNHYARMTPIASLNATRRGFLTPYRQMRQRFMEPKNWNQKLEPKNWNSSNREPMNVLSLR
jgi:hypothetical protein